MKQLSLLTLIGIIVIFSSCVETKLIRKTECTQKGDYDYLNNYVMGSLCTTDLCEQYKAIWKELFLEKNNLSETYFQNHIILCNSRINTWNDGVSFSICYKVKNDWAIAYTCDQFIIKINKDNNLYPAVSLPRDVYLSKDNVRTALNQKVFSSNMIALSNTENIIFSSNSLALTKLIKATNVNALCFTSTFINASGNISLEAWAQYTDETNSCVRGVIDLINGKTESYDTPCMIN